VGYAQAFSFAYSPRPGTPAAERAGVDPEAAAERLQRLHALLGRHQAAFQAPWSGACCRCSSKRRTRAGQVAGKSPYLNAVHLAGGPETIGRVGQARITAAVRNSLAAEAA
jgi:tRNA-2-methylthio-N6-dimethylallyladenosine synthase